MVERFSDIGGTFFADLGKQHHAQIGYHTLKGQNDY